MKRLKQQPFFLSTPFLIFANISLALAVMIFSILQGYLSLYNIVLYGTVITSLLLTIHGIFHIYCMLYAWEDPLRVDRNKTPKEFRNSHYSFSILIPARHEEQVIADTIKAAATLNYPKHLQEIFIICRYDDEETIAKAKETIASLENTNARVIIFYDEPINKPHALNIGLKDATKDVVVVFDAEDEPHKDILNIVNTTMIEKHADVVQSAVQLMNFKSHWFSTLNVLEYFFWFKSTMHFFAKCRTLPLGGNTVFFKRSWLERVSGWDEHCLTEDADIGLRLSQKRANIQVIYDERYATQEETPVNVSAFIRQRTRWNQGFLQVLGSGQWLKLPKFSQKFLALYTMMWSEIQALLFLYIPVSLLMAVRVKLPVQFAMLSSIPLYLLFIQYVIYTIGLYEFCKGYQLRFPLTAPLRILFTFFPFQLLLGFSAFRALYRTCISNVSWEKTLHVNAHRQPGLEGTLAT